MFDKFHFRNLVVVETQMSEFAAQNLSKFRQFVPRQINFSQEFKLLFCFRHEIVVNDLVIFCRQSLKEF